MLNFEETVKAASHGYVVLSLDEYNRLRDEARAAKDFMDKLVNLEYNSWNKRWEAVLDNVAVYKVAKKKLKQVLGDKMSEFAIKELKDFAYYSATIAEPKPATMADLSCDDDADDILASDD